MYVRRQTLGAAFLTSKSGGGGSMFSATRRETGDAQKFSYPNNQCPRGYRQVGAGSDGPPSGYSKPWGDYVMCRPQPQAQAAPQQAPNINTQVTVSPAIQTDVSPQISPAFFQAQDSPGASQAATATQRKEGQSADTGGTASNGAAQMIEFVRAQAEADRIRRQEEAAIRERERQSELQARLEEDRRRQEAEKAERDAQAAELQAQYQAELEATRRSHVEPSVSYVPLPASGGGGGGVPAPPPEIQAALAERQAQNGGGLPLPLIVGAVVVGGAVLYVVMRRQRGRKR